MSEIINICVAGLNGIGRGFWAHAVGVFFQTSVMIAILWVGDLMLRKRVRATIRYWIWMLVFVKLLLPPTFSVPTGIGYWLGGRITPAPVVLQPMGPMTESPAPRQTEAPVRVPGVQPSALVPEIVRPIASAVTDSESIAWQGGAFLLWSIGVLFFAGLVIQRWLFVRGLIAQSQPAQDELIDMLDQCRRRMGARRRVGLRLSPNTFSPAVCGLLHPVVLIPVALLERLSPEGLKAVLIHELAHVKRGDLWVNSLQTVLQAIYFYNPLVWLANVVVRRVREQAVDEMVLVALGAEARSYGHTLIDIAEMAFLRVSPALRLIGVAESRKSLEGRIKHMMTRPMPKNARIGLWGFLMVLAVGAVLLPMAKAQRIQGSAAQGGKHRVSAIPLTDFERTLVGQVLDLVKEVEKEYPGQTKHWPGGPGLYHVDSEGQVTVWHYRRLWRRSDDCAEDEVGWGSSEWVNATGMYYLPDGTPLQSRWWERGGGMRDIRVKIGRTIGDEERVGVIHRHGLSDQRDLLSRDNKVRTILLDSSEDAPVAIVARADRPMRLTGWWIADATTDLQHSDDHDQLTVTGPPQIGGAPMLIRVMLPEGQAYSRQTDLTGSGDEVTARLQEDLGISTAPPAHTESGERLAGLARAMLIFAHDHEDRLPNHIANLQDELDDSEEEWLLQNVAYIGKGLTARDAPDRVVAYDKTLWTQGKGTNVLFLDTHIQFQKPESLAKLGIAMPSPAQIESAQRLTALGEASLIYTINHQDRLPEKVEDLPDDAGLDKAWLLANVVYLGKGMKTHNEPDTPIAYDKTLLLEGHGTNVMYLDTQVVFEGPGRLEAIGIRDERVERNVAMDHLRRLAIAAIRYAEGHGGRFARDMGELRAYLDNEKQFAWIIANAEYLAAGVQANELGSTASTRPLAYWKTAPATLQGTVIVFFDIHGEFGPIDRLADKLAEFGITIPLPASSSRGDVFRSYDVNRSVADFPAGEDFSTPEAAYATINRIDLDDPSFWRRVSVARSAARWTQSPDRKPNVDPEWTKVLSHARIREVLMWNMTRAAVMAELPQELSSKKIVEPIDVRFLQLENGRWLNTGNDRFPSIEAARTHFMNWMGRETAQADAMRDPLRHAVEIKAAAAQLFEKLRTADYAAILSHYRDGQWDADFWKVTPTSGLYTVRTDYPSFTLWCATHFKDNPIVDVRLGDVFIGDTLVSEKTGWPTVPYKLTLKDGTTLEGGLPFTYSIEQDGGHWHAVEGIDWHLWPRGTK